MPDKKADLTDLTEAVWRISCGPVQSPGGLEAICMALNGAGDPGKEGGIAGQISNAIRDSGESIREGLMAIAEAIAEKKE